jgi:hypothetical protein
LRMSGIKEHIVCILGQSRKEESARTQQSSSNLSVDPILSTFFF